jgi:hypothetical protein
MRIRPFALRPLLSECHDTAAVRSPLGHARLDNRLATDCDK